MELSNRKPGSAGAEAGAWGSGGAAALFAAMSTAPRSTSTSDPFGSGSGAASTGVVATGAGSAAVGGMTQFLAPVLADQDEDFERSLRPRSLADFVGQERVKQQLEIALEAAKARGEALDHVLLAGPPGLGKTSLAQIVRNELGVGIRQIAGPGLERKDIAAILTSLEPRDVLFIDEIHRMSRAAEEILYPALEDFRLD